MTKNRSTNWRDYVDPATWHPAAQTFPLIPPDELEALARDIEQAGRVHDPIVLHDGVLLDGRNRVLALAWLEDQGVATRKIKVTVQNLSRAADPIAFVESKNERRRHLDRSQRAMAAAKLRALSKDGHSIRSAGKVTGAKKSLVQMADKVLAADSRLAQQVLDGKITIHRAKLQIERKELKRRALRRARELLHAPAQPMPILGKAQKHIGELDDGSVQLLLTDPPYGVRYLGSPADPKERGEMAADNPKDAPGLLREVLELLAPKLARDAHFYIFCPARSDLIFDVVKDFFRERFDLTMETLIWLKAWSGPGGQGFGPVYERIAHGRLRPPCGAPRPLLGPLRLPDVLPLPPPTRGRRTAIHKTQKPFELLQLLILHSTYPKELVVDPFAGSGSTLREARKLRRHYWGTEKEPNYQRQAIDYVQNTPVIMDDSEFKGSLDTYLWLTYKLWQERKLVGWRRTRDGSMEPTFVLNPLFVASQQEPGATIDLDAGLAQTARRRSSTKRKAS